MMSKPKFDVDRKPREGGLKTQVVIWVSDKESFRSYRLGF